MSHNLRFEDIRANPTSMTIEVTTYCSLKCVGCARTIGKDAGQWRDRHMSASLFERICAGLPTLERLTLHGIGEPTLNPDYLDIVSIAANSGKFGVIGANSHALARNPHYYQRLVDLGMNEIYVSVDSLTQAVADRTRTGTQVEALRDRLATFAAMGLPIFITVVASRFNLHDLAATLDALDHIGRFRVSVQEFIDLGRPEGCLTPSDRKQVSAILDAGQSRWHHLSITRTLSLAEGWSTPDVCADPWSGFGVTVDGYLTPCCMTWDPASFGYLNLGDLSLQEAVQSSRYQQFLRDYVAEAPGFCVGCSKNSREVKTVFVPLLRHPSERQLVAAV